MTDVNASVALLIPAYRPGGALIDLVRELRRLGFEEIVVVNDGSENAEVFERLSELNLASVIRHETNLGKGAALKTGFRHMLERLPPTVWTFVTVDADGQHLPQDVLSVSQAAVRSPDSFILGARAFDGKTPVRSVFGNILTRHFLGWANNIHLKDTQTGLRAYPRDFARATLTIKPNRYEFELQAILLASKLKLPIEEPPISTIYIDGNASSNFRPLLDSMRIYAVFARFITVSLTSFALDISIFAAAYSINNDIYLSTYIARAISLSFNFLGNKYLVFKSLAVTRFAGELLGYLLLAFFVATVSATLVDNISSLLAVAAVLVKFVVDSCLFFFNLYVQKRLVFRHGR